MRGAFLVSIGVSLAMPPCATETCVVGEPTRYISKLWCDPDSVM